MLEVPSRAFFLPPHHTDAPLQICSKLFVRTVLELVPLLLDERFQLGKELFDRIEIGRVWRQVQQLDASIAKELLDSLTAVERCVVHDGHRARFWIWPAVWWRSCSTKSSNTVPLVEPWKTLDNNIPSCVYAGRIWYRRSRWNRATSTGATPSGDQPVRLKPIRSSHPDSSMYTS
ncbi:hypothetical protein B5807_11980 [Epicoccum nigrum]|uniref:Uncharacterized protein n=1 Tax=Epicoccum nigrum TaxID=105696 RepID=A0A1Y2LHQ4_EPING|nr:hypothetical protein B5807_11980 [Epicoccum nigrum]